MKEKIKRILTLINQWKVILIIILLGAGLFYWLQIRPSNIRSFCHETAIESAKTKLQRETYSDSEGKFEPTVYETYFKQCLRAKGIKE